MIGCSEPEPLNYQMLVQRDGLYYLKDTNEIYSGPVFNIKGKSTGYIKKGKWNGEFEFYHSNGQLAGIGSYKDGDGSDPSRMTNIPRNGRTGLWKSYHDNGQLQLEGTYKDGKVDGLYKSYHDNGLLQLEGTYKDGKKDGPYKEYYENGQLFGERIYKDFKLNGPNKIYYENGQLEFERTFKDGELDGSYKYFDRKGKIIKNNWYENGILSFERNKMKGQEFLEKNKTAEGIRVLNKSQIQYRIITKGNGLVPDYDDIVKVHYEGYFINGNKFDSSYDRGKPNEFGVNIVIEGWQEILQIMPTGSKWEVFIPQNLAYGKDGVGNPEKGEYVIPPYSTLIFEIDLLEIIDNK